MSARGDAFPFPRSSTEPSRRATGDYPALHRFRFAFVLEFGAITAPTVLHDGESRDHRARR